MKTKLCFLILSLFGFFLLNVKTVQACDCGGGANPCAAFRGKTSIFIGTVKEVTDSNEKYGKVINGKVRKIRISVDEVFKGSFPPEVITSDDGYGCNNFPFALGGIYLIYTSGVLANTENIVPVGLCSGTKLLSAATNDLKFLRPLKEGKSFSTVYGRVIQFVNQKDAPDQPLQNVKVVLHKDFAIENEQYIKPKKNDREFEIFTNENGEYSFESLNAGVYRINVVVAPDLWIWTIGQKQDFTLEEKPFCENRSFSAYPDGRISGNLTRSDRTPAFNVKISAVPINKNAKLTYLTAASDKSGNFTIRGVPEGQYKLVISLQDIQLDNIQPFALDYPHSQYFFLNNFDAAQAKLVNVAHAEKVQSINLQLPPFPRKQTVSGSVVSTDGTPVENAQIVYKIRTMSNNYPRYAQVKNDGVFAFQIYDEFEYEVFAAIYQEQKNIASERFIINKDNAQKQLKIVLATEK